MNGRTKVASSLNASELALFQKMNSPIKIQNYLDSLPYNFGDTYMSPRRVLREKKAHCAEGALFAAAALAYHGEKPLLMDLKVEPEAKDVDHVVALFRRGKYWGAISKTNYPVLRYRDPIYPDIRSLALSYFHEYFLDDGTKTLRAYSAPFDLSKYAPEKWVTAEDELEELIDALDESRHFPIVPRKNRRLIRNATKIEIRATALREWQRPRRAKRR